MGVGDVVEDHIQEPIAAVTGGQCTPQPVPLCGVVVGQVWVGMLQQRDHDQPEVDNEVRNDV